MGKTNLQRVAAYVPADVAAKLEAIRRERGARSISAVAADVLAEAVLGRVDDRSGAAFEFAKAVAPVEPNGERVAERAFALADAFATVKQRRRDAEVASQKTDPMASQ